MLKNQQPAKASEGLWLGQEGRTTAPWMGRLWPGQCRTHRVWPQRRQGVQVTAWVLPISLDGRSPPPHFCIQFQFHTGAQSTRAVALTLRSTGHSRICGIQTITDGDPPRDPKSHPGTDPSIARRSRPCSWLAPRSPRPGWSPVWHLLSSTPPNPPHTSPVRAVTSL